ncbi:MAG: branched-chain amino acid ABC transporter permease [Pseudaminobacter sp.]
MDLFLQVIANSIVLGSIYAVMAFGLVIVFGVMRVINFAHGVLAVLGAYASLQLYRSLGIDPFISLLVTVPLFFALGWLLYKILFSRLGPKSESTSMVVSFGVGIIIEVLIIMAWSANFQAISLEYGTNVISFGPVRLTYVRVISILIAFATVIALTVFLARAKLGKAIRAVIQDREAATYVGINVEHVAAVTFGIAIGSVALGGVLLGSVYAFYPAVHLDWIGRLFAIVVLGGMGSISGAFVGAFIMAFAESFVSLQFGSSWAPAVSFSLIILVLLLRPGGIAGVATAVRA